MEKRWRAYMRVMLLRIAVGGLVGCHLVAVDPPPHGRALPGAFDEAIPQLMHRRGVPGVAIALVGEGEVTWVKGYGWADQAQQRPVTAHTVFQAASLSKPVSAWAAMTLVEQGQLALDAPVARYLTGTRWQLPAWPFDSDGVTVRRLLSHTAGLSIPGYQGFAPGQRVQSLEASLTSAADAAGGPQPLAVIFPPGHGWHYSGGGYTLLQLIIEQVTGQSFAGFAQRTVLQPLGMPESTFEAPPRALRALAYDHTGAPTPEYRFTATAAAGLWTTAADLAHVVAALMGGTRGEPPGRGLLAPATVALMLAPQPHSANDLLFEGSEFGLGYALKRLPSSGEWLVYHPGDNPPGWHGMLAALPARRIGLVVLTNGEAGRELRLDAFCLWFRLQGAETLGECRQRDRRS
jgi:CubicO group peptidase (beta-lactamase class C family)